MGDDSVAESVEQPPEACSVVVRLFESDTLRVRAMTLIFTVGLVGLAIIGIRIGIARDEAVDLHRDPIDIAGAVLGTATIVLALVTPTLFVNEGTGSWAPWTATAVTLVLAILFVLRERSARYPLLARPEAGCSRAGFERPGV
jgi:hypothetical protein